MTTRYVKCFDSEETEFLQKKHPNAFLLLAAIARRARRTQGSSDGLKIGEAFIGDYKNCGIESERKYRTAKAVLIRLGYIDVVNTSRTREKSTTGATTVGTKVKLLKSTIWDINPESSDDREDERATTDRRPTDDEQECKNERRYVSNVPLSIDIFNKHESETLAQHPPGPRHQAPQILFSFHNRKFENISPQDLSAWKELYPSINVEHEIALMVEWCLSNPQKAKSKKLWRKFITNWLTGNNEKAVNRQAFKSKTQSGFSSSSNNAEALKKIQEAMENAI